jgi:hypothetical protein
MISSMIPSDAYRDLSFRQADFSSNQSQNLQELSV